MKKQFYFVAGMLAGVLMMIMSSGCAVSKRIPPTEVVIKFQSEIPVTVTLPDSCKGNWNFCGYERW